MKDRDTKLLSEMYNTVNTTLCENAPVDANLSAFVERELPNYEQNKSMQKVLDAKAKLIVESIQKTTKDPMITRVLKQYSDASNITKAKILHKVLSL